MAQLEAQIHAVAQALNAQSFPGPRRTDDARRRFFVRYGQLDQETPDRTAAVSRLDILREAFSWGRAALATAVLACFVGLGLWLSSRPSTPAPADVIARVQKFEAGLYSGAVPVHQVFRLELQEIKPQMRTLTGRLEVWSESDEGRFLARWEQPDGTLRYANQRVDSGAEYLFNPAEGPAPVLRKQRAVRDASFVRFSVSRPDFEQLESEFLRWLAARRWRPISFAGEVYAFSRQEGVVLHLERIRFGDGGPVLRLTARRASEGRLVELVVEVDANTYRPRLQSIQLEENGRAVKLRLVAERVEAVPRARLVDAVFKMGVPFHRPGVGPRAEASAPTSAELEVPRLAPQGEVRRMPSAAELNAAEMAARYALHRVRACLGEPVNVVRDPVGVIRIQGLAETVERKQQLLAALSELQPISFVAVDIKTVEEAMTGSSSSRSMPLADSAPVSESTSRRIVETPLAIRPQLERYFAGLTPNESPAASVTDSIARFSSEVLSDSRSTLAEAWALRRLGERYAESSGSLGPQSRWLLEIMLRDHLTAVRSREAGMRSRLDPVLSSIVGGKGPSRSASQRAWNVRADGWAAGCLAVFEIMKRADALVAAVFAGADLPTEIGAEGEEVRLGWADEPAIDLLKALAAVEAGCENVQGQIAREFAGNPDRLSSRDRPE